MTIRTPDLLLTLLLTLLPGILLAQPAHIIQLQNRPAIELLPIIKPLLKTSDGISADGFNLFIRCDQPTLTQIRPLIQQLDTAPASLLISVRAPGTGHADKTRINANANPNPSPNLTRNNPRLLLESTEQTRSIGNSSKIRALEGRQVYIRSGRAVAYPKRTFIRNGQYIIEQQTQDYLPVESGFYVTARLIGTDEVILSIETQQQNLLDNQSIAQQRLATEIRGRLGEWLTLGGVAQTADSTGTGIIHYSTAKRQDEHSVQLKVERATDSRTK